MTADSKNARGENAVALIVLHIKEKTGETPSNKEVEQFIFDNGLLGDVLSMDWEKVNKKLKTLKEGENDGTSGEA